MIVNVYRMKMSTGNHAQPEVYYTLAVNTIGEVRDAFPASRGWLAQEVSLLTLKEAVEHARANSKDR